MKEESPLRSHRRLIILFILFLVVAGAAAFFYWQKYYSADTGSNYNPPRITTTPSQGVFTIGKQLPLAAGINTYRIETVGTAILQSGFQANTGSSPVQVTFPQAFASTPTVVASRNWNGGDEENIRVYDVTAAGFKYQGDGDTWTTQQGATYKTGVNWMAITGTQSDKLKFGFQANTGATPIQVTFPKAFAKAPVVVASRNWFGDNEENIRIYDVTAAGFKYQGDGDTWKTQPGATYAAGVYWVATIANGTTGLKAGFKANTGASPVQVTFSKAFAIPPVVVVSRNWFGDNEEMIRVYDVTATGFKYQGDGDTWKTQPGAAYAAGVYWVALPSGVGYWNNAANAFTNVTTFSNISSTQAVQSGFNLNNGKSPIQVTFPQAFKTVPAVVASRNWFGQNEENIRIYDVTVTGFKYQGDGDTWTTNNAGIYWVAVSGADTAKLKSGFKANTGASPAQVTFPQAFSKAPKVVASRNWFGQDEEMIRVYDITATGFKYQGDGDTRKTTGSPAYTAGVYWLAVDGDIEGRLKSGFKANTGTTPVQVTFPKAFAKAPNVVASRNWFGQNEENIRIYDVTVTGFKYQGDGDTWKTQPGATYAAGVNWVAIDSSGGYRMVYKLPTGVTIDPTKITGSNGMTSEYYADTNTVVLTYITGGSSGMISNLPLNIPQIMCDKAINLSPELWYGSLLLGTETDTTFLSCIQPPVVIPTVTPTPVAATDTCPAIKINRVKNYRNKCVTLTGTVYAIQRKNFMISSPSGKIKILVPEKVRRRNMKIGNEFRVKGIISWKYGRHYLTVRSWRDMKKIRR